MKFQFIILFYFLSSLLCSLDANAENDDDCEINNAIITKINYIVKAPHQLIEKNESSWLKIFYTPTKQETIEQYLTFKLGSKVNIKKIKETIRKLRAAKFIWDSTYQLTIKNDCTASINITVHDTFPFRPKLAFTRKNGANSTSFGLINKNLFGSGTSLQIEVKNNKLREEKIIEYINPNFAKRHYFFKGLYSDNSDGKQIQFRFAKPFHHLDSTASFDSYVNLYDSNLELYNNTEIAFQSNYSKDTTSLSYAFLTKSLLHYERSRISFNIKDEQAEYDSLALMDRHLVEFSASLELFDTDFIEVKNIRNMNQFEDYNQGVNLAFSFGAIYDQLNENWSPKLSASLSKTTVYNPYTVLITEINYSHKSFSNYLNQSKISSHFEYNYFDEDYQQSWNAKIKYKKLQNPNPENFISMDEEFPIRGFPYGYRLGDSMIALNIEKRWFNLANIFEIFNVAAVAFYDIGQISLENSDIFSKQKTTLQSAGVGLRISPSKFSKNIVVHIDLAFPQGNDIDDNYQLNIFGLRHF